MGVTEHLSYILFQWTSAIFSFNMSFLPRVWIKYRLKWLRLDEWHEQYGGLQLFTWQNENGFVTTNYLQMFVIDGKRRGCSCCILNADFRRRPCRIIGGWHENSTAPAFVGLWIASGEEACWQRSLRTHLELDSRWSSISVFVSCLLALEVLVMLTDID